MGALRQDFGFAVRQLRRNVWFTVVVVATLALAVGANTAVFSLVNALLLQPLPYRQPGRMATAYAKVSGGSASGWRFGINGERWELLRDDVPAVMAGVKGITSGVDLKAGSRVQYVSDGRISEHYLNVLGVLPALGRNFTAEEDSPHGPKAAILSYRLWQKMFGGNRDVLGHAIELKGEPYTVVGVLPKGAHTPQNAEVYTALQASTQGEGAGTNFQAIVRLRKGATWAQANAQINQAWAQVAERMEKQNPGVSERFFLVPLQKANTKALAPQVLALILASGMILLIACANLAGLTLVRMMRRSQEIATRLALGASRWQIERQFWMENLLPAVMGGAAGIGVGFLGLRGFLMVLPKGYLPVEHVTLDTRVLLFTLGISVVTSVLFGMLPALTARKVDLRSSMGHRTLAGSGTEGLRRAFITAEIAMTVVLLAASGLLIHTLVHLETLTPGFNPKGVTVAQASLDDVRYYDPAAFRKLLAESVAAMKRIPGVESAAVGLSLPWQRPINSAVMLHDGKMTGKEVGTDVIYVTPGYFEVLQMPLLAGRAITAEDGPDTQKVAVVNKAFARKFYGGANPVGHYLGKSGAGLIVGEVANVPVNSGLTEGAPLMTEPAMYFPATQVKGGTLALISRWKQPDWIVRTGHPVEGLTKQMQAALASVDPNLPFSGFYSMDDFLHHELATQRVEVALLGVMALMALLLSTIGIFALVANMVTERTREIGIRMALGATIATAMLTIARKVAVAAVIGIGAGLVLCAAVLRTMHSVLYGVRDYDPLSLGFAVVALGLVALIATVIPSLRIARIDPAHTLREE